MKNLYESFNSYFNIFDDPTYEGEFYNIEKLRKDSLAQQNWDKDAIYWNSFVLNNKEFHHERSIYGLMDLIGELGGVKEILVSIIGLIMLPISSFGF